MATLRIIGDVHGQITPDDLFGGTTRPYLEIIAGVSCSIQVGDMGDRETYDLLTQHVDAGRHRFFPGNHDHYHSLPPHCLGDFGATELGGVNVFFLRGAASSDKDKLVRLGQQLGKTLWYEEEELSDEQMAVAEEMYRTTRPTIVLTHDAPTDVAHRVWEYGPAEPAGKVSALANERIPGAIAGAARAAVVGVRPSSSRLAGADGRDAVRVRRRVVACGHRRGGSDKVIGTLRDRTLASRSLTLPASFRL